MQSLEFTVKVITPTLMGGGFGQNDGIRPPEIKGMMRYWFRTVAGSVIGNDIKALKSLEEKVFGSQERKSPFRIVISGLKETDKINLSWLDLPNGVKYLGFVINMNKERLNNVIKAGSEFKVKFLFKNSVDNKIIKIVTYSFYLATALGGFGLRPRRGFGSWQILSIDTRGITEDLEYLKNYDLGNIKEVIIKLRNLTGLNQNRNLNFRTVSENFICIHKLNGSSWKNAFDDLGKRYQSFRRNGLSTTPEYHNIKNYIKFGCNWRRINKNNWNFAFGLPIQINSKKGIPSLLGLPPKKNRRGNIIPTSIGIFKIKHNSEILERLPSSVWFSIKEKDGNYYVVLTYLEGKLFPDENHDKVVFQFDKDLNLQSKCKNPPKSVEVEYDANDLKQRAKDFVSRGR